jgi:transposase
MAMQVTTAHCGIDVSKNTLDIALDPASDVISIVNSPTAIADWLNNQDSHLVIGVEATGIYHVALVEQAMALGHQVYLINPRQIKHYREALGVRAKTDIADALLIRRYLCQEQAHLRPLSLQNKDEKQLWLLLKRRGKVVKIRQQLKLSCENMPDLEHDTQETLEQLKRLIKAIDRAMQRLSRKLEWQPMMERLESIPGIGAQNALALTACYHRGEFRSVDAFIAFLGLDVRVRDSGMMRGRRKLTKQGEPEIRRLLYNAAMSFNRNPEYQAYRESLLARGLSSTAAYVVIARKLARVAFTLLRKNREFDPNIFTIPCK